MDRAKDNDYLVAISMEILCRTTCKCLYLFKSTEM